MLLKLIIIFSREILLTCIFDENSVQQGVSNETRLSSFDWSGRINEMLSLRKEASFCKDEMLHAVRSSQVVDLHQCNKTFVIFKIIIQQITMSTQDTFQLVSKLMIGIGICQCIHILLRRTLAEATQLRTKHICAITNMYLESNNQLVLRCTTQETNRLICILFQTKCHQHKVVLWPQFGPR